MIRMLLLDAAILMLVVGCEKPPVDASVSVLIVVGAGIIFLVTLGIRIRRERALKAIHELRSIAHLIDMHKRRTNSRSFAASSGNCHTLFTSANSGLETNNSILRGLIIL